MASGAAALDVEAGKSVKAAKSAPSDPSQAAILAAPSPLRALSKRGESPFAEHPDLEDLRADCAQLRGECQLHEERRREAESRAAQLEKELAALKAASTPAAASCGKQGPTAEAPPGHEQTPESPRHAKLLAEAKRASSETAAFWQALQAEVAAPVLQTLRKQDAASRAAAEAKLEKRLRNELWEALQASVDGPTVVAVAQRIGGSRDREPALPVHVARRLFEGAQDRPAVQEVQGAKGRCLLDASSRIGVGVASSTQGLKLQKTPRASSMPTARDTSNARRGWTRSQTQSDSGQDMVMRAEAATPASSKVRDRVREFEFSGARR